MQSTAQNGDRLAKIVETEKDFARLQQHLKEVIEGEAFKGSLRSGQFLSYIVEESLAGRYSALKERVIGVKLFGRSPAYDTGEDAIVRVTASDVRRRLLQHYGRYGDTSQFRIRLQPGSYVPEIEHLSIAAQACGNSPPLPMAVSAEQELRMGPAPVPRQTRWRVPVFWYVIAAVLIVAVAVVVGWKPVEATA